MLPRAQPQLLSCTWDKPAAPGAQALVPKAITYRHVGTNGAEMGAPFGVSECVLR